VRRGRRYVVDTNVYIDALRTEPDRSGLSAFLSTFAPFVWLSAVVAQELRAGVRGSAVRVLDSGLLAPFERRDRIITPSYAAWKEAGSVLSQLVGAAAWTSVSRSFVNDVLLALSCRESGAVLVTRNVSDFTRIATVRPFDFVLPWPT
jgi:predicted nucleic acid-binding protein